MAASDLRTARPRCRNGTPRDSGAAMPARQRMQASTAGRRRSRNSPAARRAASSCVRRPPVIRRRSLLSSVGGSAQLGGATPIRRPALRSYEGRRRGHQRSAAALGFARGEFVTPPTLPLNQQSSRVIVVAAKGVSQQPTSEWPSGCILAPAFVGAGDCFGLQYVLDPRERSGDNRDAVGEDLEHAMRDDLCSRPAPVAFGRVGRAAGRRTSRARDGAAARWASQRRSLPPACGSARRAALARDDRARRTSARKGGGDRRDRPASRGCCGPLSGRPFVDLVTLQARAGLVPASASVDQETSASATPRSRSSPARDEWLPRIRSRAEPALLPGRDAPRGRLVAWPRLALGPHISRTIVIPHSTTTPRTIELPTMWASPSHKNRGPDPLTAIGRR